MYFLVLTIIYSVIVCILAYIFYTENADDDDFK